MPPPLVTRGFVILAAAALAFFIAAGVVLPVAPQFARDALGADAIGIGVSIAAFSIAALALRPVVGWSSDRYGRRPLLIGGAIVTVVALALHLVVADLATFIVVRGLLGVGEGFFLVAVLAAGADIAPSERRGEALSFLSVSLYLGVAIGPFVGESMLRGSGYSGVWVVAVAIGSVAVALTWLTPETAPAVVGRAGRPRAPLIHPAGLFPGVIVLLGLWGMAGFLTFIPLYVPEVGLADAGMPLALYALIVVGLRIVGARDFRSG